MTLTDKIKKGFTVSFEVSAMFIRNCKKLLFLDVFIGISQELRQLIITVLPSVVIWLCAGYKYSAVTLVIATMVGVIAVSRDTYRKRQMRPIGQIIACDKYSVLLSERQKCPPWI